MLDIATLVPNLIKRAKKLPVGQYLDVRSYKCDRYLLIIKLTEDLFKVVEHGFEEAEIEVDAASLKRTLKTLTKREFPRSNKIRVYTLGAYEKEKASLQRIQI